MCFNRSASFLRILKYPWTLPKSGEIFHLKNNHRVSALDFCILFFSCLKKWSIIRPGILKNTLHGQSWIENFICLSSPRKRLLSGGMKSNRITFRSKSILNNGRASHFPWCAFLLPLLKIEGWMFLQQEQGKVFGIIIK